MDRTHHPEANIVVMVIGLIPVANHGGGIVMIVVPRAAPHETGPPDPSLRAGEAQCITRKDQSLQSRANSIGG